MIGLSTIYMAFTPWQNDHRLVAGGRFALLYPGIELIKDA